MFCCLSGKPRQSFNTGYYVFTRIKTCLELIVTVFAQLSL